MSLNGIAEKVSIEKLEEEISNLRLERDALYSRSNALETIFRNSLDVNMIVDDSNHQILLVSDCVEHYLGYSPESLLGKSLFSLFPTFKDEKDVTNFLERTKTFDAVLADQEFLNSGNRAILMDMTITPIQWQNSMATLVSLRETKERRRAERRQRKLVKELKEALSKVKLLSGFLPICASCKKIRDDQGYWTQIEEYIRAHSEAEFSHGICPECVEVQYEKMGLK